MNNRFYLLATLVVGLCLLPMDAFAQRRGGGRGNSGGRPAPQSQPRGQQPRVQEPRVQEPRVQQPQPSVRVPDVRVPDARVPGVTGGAGANAGVRVDSGVRRAGFNATGNVRASNIYRNDINIGQRSINIAPSTYRPSYQNYNWHRGYWNNTYGWNPQIGYGSGFGGYGNYGGYGIRLGNFSIGTGGYGGYGGYGYGRYPMGWGYGGWGLGNLLYGSGYMPYYNPYWGGGLGGAYAYNYAQPIYVSTSVPSTADVATQTFDSARGAFKAGDYATALKLVDRAIKDNPSDEVLHEFRALTLFAQKDFNGAAATIHSVLAVGPGWDWATMVSLYSSVDDYTAQLRALETFTKSNPDDAASRFLLGYHYMTTGHPEHAAKEFASVVKLQPKDRVARDLLNLVDKPKDADVVAAPAPREEETTPVAKPAEAARPIEASAILGEWNSTRDDGSKFDLDLRKDNTFTWKFDQGNRHEDFSGTYTTEGSLLLLQKQDGGALVGHVAQAGDGKFTFKLLGAPADDPGLTFVR
jgi:tetratricopeptide (TPR) repeat protein